MTLTASDRASWLETIWEAIHALEDCQPETDIDDVKTAMAWLAEELGLELDDNGDYIAAAPDLLAALANLLALTELHIGERSKTPEEEDNFLSCHHITQARAAIAKTKA